MDLKSIISKMKKRGDERVKSLTDALEAKTREAEGYRTACFNLLEKSTAEIVVGKALNRDLSWFDYNALPTDEQETYFKEAQAILNSRVFKNETNAVILDMVQEIAMRTKDFDQVLSLRTKIAMLEAFKERLQRISGPKPKPEDPKEPFSVL